MPEGAVYVGRPTKYGNPFHVDDSWLLWTGIGLGYRGDLEGRRGIAVALFEAWMTDQPVKPGPATRGGGSLEFSDGTHVTFAEHARNVSLAFAALVAPPDMPKRPDIDALRGRDLACYCPLDAPCHADVLLEIANSATAGSL